MHSKGSRLSALRRLFGGASAQKPQSEAALAVQHRDEINRQRLLNGHSPFAVTEAYKSVRTNLLFTRAGAGCQRIVFTSAMESEGKTLNCLNLGITLAQSDLRVLIIDADLRRPMVQHDLNLASGYGLSELLAGLVPAEVQGDPTGALAATDYPNLSVLTSGPVPPNPAELLASPRMAELLDALSAVFDFILIDTPPVALVTDAAVLCKNVSGYLLIVRAGHTSLDGLRDCVQRLEQVGGNIIGFLLNGVELHTGYYKYKRYGRYGHYGRYGSYGRYGDAPRETAAASPRAGRD